MSTSRRKLRHGTNVNVHSTQGVDDESSFVAPIGPKTTESRDFADEAEKTLPGQKDFNTLSSTGALKEADETTRALPSKKSTALESAQVAHSDSFATLPHASKDLNSLDSGHAHPLLEHTEALPEQSASIESTHNALSVSQESELSKFDITAEIPVNHLSRKIFKFARMPNSASPLTFDVFVKSNSTLSDLLEARQTNPGLPGPYFLGLPIAEGDWYSAEVIIKRAEGDTTVYLWGKPTWEDLLNAIHERHETTTNVETRQRDYVRIWDLHVILLWGGPVTPLFW